MYVQGSRLQDELARFNGTRVASTAIQIPRLMTLTIRSHQKLTAFVRCIMVKYIDAKETRPCRRPHGR
jgi:hypothetical protein